MNYGHVLFQHKCKSQFIYMHGICYCQKNLQSQFCMSPAHFKSNVHMKTTQRKNKFPSYQQLRDLAYVQGSKFAASCIRDPSNHNARQNVKVRLECIQKKLFTRDHLYLDSWNHLLILKMKRLDSTEHQNRIQHPKKMLNKSFSACKFVQTLHRVWRHHNKARTNLIHKRN